MDQVDQLTEWKGWKGVGKQGGGQTSRRRASAEAWSARSAVSLADFWAFSCRWVCSIIFTTRIASFSAGVSLGFPSFSLPALRAALGAALGSALRGTATAAAERGAAGGGASQGPDGAWLAPVPLPLGRAHSGKPS